MPDTRLRPRILLSDRATALTAGRTLARVDMHLPAGFDALPIRQRSDILRDELSSAADAFDAFLEQSA